MMEVAANTPILIGVGQASERQDSPDNRRLSPVELAAAAARAACEDALSLADLACRIDAIYAVRTVADTVPTPFRAQRAPFGTPDNMPAAVARRIGATPSRTIYSPACGDEPQKLVGEACERLHAGEMKMVLLCGGEAGSTLRAALAAKETLDWSDQTGVTLEDRRWNMGEVRTRHMNDHKMIVPTTVYALFENARRRRLRLPREAYAEAMGRLMAPFTRIAAGNPHAASRRPLSAEEIAGIDDSNRMIADPHPKAVVARDLVNLGAALLLTTVGEARAAGVPEDKWVFLHGYSALHERPVHERADLGSSPALALAYREALSEAGIGIGDVRHMDLYSCFPIAVFAAADALGLDADDPRGLTVTGGLPYFGGPGNNYSMHAIAEIVARLRAEPGSYGLVGANGGFLSTHAVAVYSTAPRAWRNCDSSLAQRAVDALPAPPFVHDADGWATVETYTVLYAKGEPTDVIVIGRLDHTGERFFANSIDGDQETLRVFVSDDGLDRRIHVRWHEGINRFALDRESLDARIPKAPLILRQSYEHVLVERRGHLLEVTINRPDVNNALTPEANEELAQIFDVYDADDELWVAIIAGAGTKAFCTGNDLKATATGRRLWVPRTGFAGLTARVGRVKPVICAVNGFAMGGGFEIALACDLIVADETAQFALSEVRVGLLAGAGGLQRLTRQIPLKQAMELILTGRRASAREGAALGFVNRVAPAGTALDGARALAAEILDCSPMSIRCTKELLDDQARTASETDAVRTVYRALDHVANAEDRIEGVTAFIQKRKPQWTNR